MPLLRVHADWGRRLVLAISDVPPHPCITHPFTSSGDGCDTFPKTPVTFSELKLVGTDGAHINATWLANPKPAKDLQCKEATQINGPDNVVISFR